MIKCLYEPFRKWSEKGSVYLYSDPHFGDLDSYNFRNILNVPDDIMFAKEQGDSRPYELYVEERLKVLDEMQIKNINKRITKNDTIIFLGDIGDIECIKKIKGYKVLIMGNHDKGASNYKREIHYYSNLGEIFIDDLSGLEKSEIRVEDNHLFDEVYEGPLMISEKIILSHEPIQGLPSYIFNIHGHDHSGYDFMEYVLKHFDSEMPEKEVLDNYIWTIKKEGLNKLNICAEWTAYNPVDLQNDLIKKGLFSKTKDIHTDYIDKRNGRN